MSVQPSPREPKATLLAIIKAIAGVQVVWSTDRRQHLGQMLGKEHAWIFASIASWTSVGIDQLRMVYNATKDANDELLVGQRQFTLRLKAQSYDATLEAMDLCERVRFRLRTPTARALFNGIIALVDIPPTVMLPEETVVAGGIERCLLTASMDVRMACVVASDPLDPDGGGYIATVDGGGFIPGTLTP